MIFELNRLTNHVISFKYFYRIKKSKRAFSEIRHDHIISIRLGVNKHTYRSNYTYI